MTSSIKASLHNSSGTLSFQLTSKVTTIGRENCDIIINNQTIDAQHAKIEYLENEKRYLIQDLNSKTGTYINDRRLRNASTNLDNEAQIRFGFRSEAFHFRIQEQVKPPILSTTKKTAKESRHEHQLKLINETIPSSSSSGGVRFEASIPNDSSIWINIPASSVELLSTTRNDHGNKSTLPSRTERITADYSARPVTCEIYNPKKSVTYVEPQYTDSKLAKTTNKDYELKELERELKSKNTEIKDLIEKLSILHTQQRSSQTQLNALKHEVVELKYNKNLLADMIGSLDKDVTLKNATISKQAREIDLLERRLRERDGKKGEESELEILRRELADANNSVLALYADNEAANEKIDALEKQLTKKDDKSEEVQREHESSGRGEEVEVLKQKISDLENELQVLKSENNGFQDALRVNLIAEEEKRRELNYKQPEEVDIIYEVGIKRNEIKEQTNESTSVHLAEIESLKQKITDLENELKSERANKEVLKQKLEEKERNELEFVRQLNEVKEQLSELQLLNTAVTTQNNEQSVAAYEEEKASNEEILNILRTESILKDETIQELENELKVKSNIELELVKELNEARNQLESLNEHVSNQTLQIELINKT